MYDNDFMAREIDNEYLMHYGRKGMKWYQHIFTDIKAASAAVKAERAKRKLEKQEYDKANPKPVKLTRKRVKSMSVEEIDARIKRLSKERELLSLNKQINEMSSANMSAGRRFFKSLGGKVIMPAVRDGSKEALEKWVKRWLSPPNDQNQGGKKDTSNDNNNNKNVDDLPKPENLEGTNKPKKKKKK